MSDEKNKSSLDEQTFAKLLEAAYVLQEHNREMRQMEESLELHSEQLRQQEAESQAALLRSAHGSEASTGKGPPPNADYTLTLAEIVEAQHQIQIRHLESDKAMEVVAERIARITNATGAAIGILTGKMIRYRAGAGAPAPPLGSEMPLETAVCAICVRTGQVLRTPNVNTEFLFDPDLCRARDIQSLVAVPIYHDGNIVGALELYFDRLNGFVEQDIHTCQLMAGLVTEAIGRDAGSALRKSMAAERSSMLAAIEKLQPNLAALAGDQANDGANEPAQDHANEQFFAIAAENGGSRAINAGENLTCWRCGSQLIEAEPFCGKCGAPRVGDRDPSSVQSKLASALHMQQASQQPPFAPANGAARMVAAFKNEPDGSIATNTIDDKDQTLQPLAVSELEEQDSLSVAASGAGEIGQNHSSGDLQRGKSNPASTAAALVKSQQPEFTWSSAAKARDFLEALAATRSPSALARFWRARRGDFYLAVAVILVAVVIRWGILSNHSAGAAGSGSSATGSAARRRLPADADLSMFDKLLISLGLAEAPEAPEYKGNPNTQVWIDPHTALYYCPGTELYGKTPKGKFASQHDAQLDQFEPASRKACD